MFNISQFMYFNVLTVKGRPPPQYTFPFVVIVPDGGRYKRPKHVVGDKWMHSV